MALAKAEIDAHVMLIGLYWQFFNQAHAWFLEIDPVWIVGLRVCVSVSVSVPEAINN